MAVCKTRAPRWGIISIMVASLALNGCVTTGQDPATMTPAQKRMRESADEFNRTVIEGAVVGAVAGALLGALLSDRNNRGRNAAIGAGAGGALGAASGYYVAKQKESYGNKEAMLNSMIADVQKDNARIAQTVQASNEVINEHRAEVQRIKASLAAKAITPAEAQRRLGPAIGDQKYMKSTVDNLNKKQAEYVKASQQLKQENPGVNSAELDRQIREMSQQISHLERNLADLVSETALSPVA